MKKERRSLWVKYILLFFALIIMCRANIFRSIHPFGYSFAYALVACNQSAIVIAILYFVGSILLDFSIKNIIVGFGTIVGIILIFLIQRVTKKKLANYLMSILMLVSQSLYLYLNIISPETLLVCVVNILIGFVCYHIFVVSIDAIFKRGARLQFTLDEKICHAFMLIIMFSGLSQIYIFNFNVTNLICIVILFGASRTMPSTINIVLATLLGIGTSLSTSSIVPVAVFAVWSCVMIAFSNNKKIISALMVLASDVIIGCFLNAYGSYDLWIMAPVVLGLLIVTLIPKNKLDKIALMCGGKKSIASNYADIMNIRDVRQKISNLSNVFAEMQNVYRTLLVGPIDKSAATSIIASEVVKKSCFNCENYKKCHKSELDMHSAFESMVHACVNKGRISVVDVPRLLSSECDKIQGVIASANAVVSSFNFLVDETKARDCVNLQVSNQLGATANLLGAIVQKFNNNLFVDASKSADLFDELVYNGVRVSDVVCLMDNKGIYAILLAIENSDALNPDILLSINKLFGVKFAIRERKLCEVPGYSILIAKSAGNFDVTYGVATVAKKAGMEPGDHYSITKIDENKYLYAISDGKGSGDNASAISTATISLIENFYKAGFSSDIIIDSVNKLLLPAGEENFACLDAAIVDTESGRCDFIKIGASISVIKGEEKSYMVEGESLPLGIIEKIAPSSQTVYLEGKDIVIIASDGIVDSFSSPEVFLQFVNNEMITNPQILAENIMDEANARRKGEKDDMTILAIKMIPK